MSGREMLDMPEPLAALRPQVTPPPALPRRARFAHKGDFGRVYILAGSLGMTGAPVLAAAGALKTGAGLVRVAVPQRAYPAVAAKLVCAMAYPLPEEEDGVSERALGDILRACRPGVADGVLLGPGWGSGAGAARVARGVIAGETQALVLDADGINALAGHIDVLDARRDKTTVLTPHFGEFCRLLGQTPEDPYESAREFALRHGCILVLKGHRTLTAFPNGQTFVNPTGNPGMATGGAGDVLAGMVVSLLAQGFAPEWAVPAAVYLHGRAGDLAAEALGEYALTATDLLAYLPAAMKEAERRGAHPEGTRESGDAPAGA